MWGFLHIYKIKIMSVISEIYQGQKIVNIYKSSNIKGSTYDRETGELIIEFNGGRKYLYEDISDVVAANLRRAKSQGVFFNKEIARKYKYKLLK